MWVKDFSSVEPREFEKASNDTWIQRRSIKKIEDPESGSIYWVSEIRFISDKEYRNVYDQKQLILETANSLLSSYDLYQQGYDAAMILLGQEA